jgi:hypothetical protein
MLSKKRTGGSGEAPAEAPAGCARCGCTATVSGRELAGFGPVAAGMGQAGPAPATGGAADPGRHYCWYCGAPACRRAPRNGG